MTTQTLERPTITPAPAMPTKLSEWLTEALNDVEALEDDSRYVINMSAWHHSEPRKPCEICMAGAIMVRRCGVEPTETIRVLHGRFPPEMAQVFRAIDHLRMGCVDAAYNNFYGEQAPGPIAALDFIATPYEADRAEFKAQMRELIEDLRRHGV